MQKREKDDAISVAHDRLVNAIANSTAIKDPDERVKFVAAERGKFWSLVNVIRGDKKILGLVSSVKTHARRNLGRNGWDAIAEAYEDFELAKVIGGAINEAYAIEAARKVAKLNDARRREATAF